MSKLYAGSASVDITPDAPVPLCGYPTTIESPAFRDGPRPELSIEVRDPIAVKSLVVSDGETTVAVVASDLLNVYHEFSEAVREAVADLGIDEIVLTATHTHSAPYMPGLLLEINPFLAFETDVSPVVERIHDGFVECVRAAHADLGPATLRVGRAENDVTAVNRRIESGPVDSELLVLHVTDATGEETVLVNYTCHPVCLSANTAVISADYLAEVYRQVDEELGGATTLFVNGAAGDINPRDIKDRYDDESAYTTEIGAEIAETTLDAITDARSNDPLEGTVEAARRDIDLPLREVPDVNELRDRVQQLDAKIDTLDAAGDGDTVFDRKWDRIYAQEQLNIATLDAEAVPATIQYVGIADLGLVSFPGEAFVQHGLDLKSRADDRPIVVAGFANEYDGYLPTLREFEDSGYEVRTCKVTAEAVEMIREAAFGLLPESGIDD